MRLVRLPRLPSGGPGRGPGRSHVRDPALGPVSQRAGSALVRTVAQVTVFKGRPWVSFFHAFVFYGFVFYLLVNVVDGIKGLVPPAWLGWMRFGLAGDLFRLGADLFGALVLVGVLAVRPPLRRARYRA